VFVEIEIIKTEEVLETDGSMHGTNFKAFRLRRIASQRLLETNSDWTLPSIQTDEASDSQCRAMLSDSRFWISGAEILSQLEALEHARLLGVGG